MRREPIETVRSFNRLVTLRVGALNDSYLGRGRPLGQARLLFEIGAEGRSVGELRENLGLDSGYASRLVDQLRRQGLIAIAPDPADRRRRRVTLTDEGRAERAAYDTVSDELAASLLGNLDENQRARLLAAMAEVERLMTAAEMTIAVEPPDSEAALNCLEHYFAELAETFEEGFDPGAGGAAGAAGDASMLPPDGCFLVARLHGAPIACGGLKGIDADTAEIKRMWVSPQARGLGLAKRLVVALEDEAKKRRKKRIVLDTNRALTTAQALYRNAGYRAIERFNDNPYADFWFEKVVE